MVTTVASQKKMLMATVCTRFYQKKIEIKCPREGPHRLASDAPFSSSFFMPIPPAVTRQNLQAFPVVSFSYSRGCREAQTRPRHTSPRAPRPVCSPPLMQTFRTSMCEQFTPRTAHFSDLHPFPRRRADTRETRWPKFWTTQQILTPTSERWMPSRHALCSSLDICTLLRRPAAVFLRRKCLMTLYGL